MEGADDGGDSEGFDLDAGGMVVDEGAAEVDDGQLAGLFAWGGVGVGEEKEVVDGWASLEGMGGGG